MKKDFIGEVLFSVKRRQQTLCLVKIYKDGRIYRSGNGIKPCGDFTLYTEPFKSKIFSENLKNIPEHLSSTRLFGQEKDINEFTTEYVLAFYGGMLSQLANGQESWEYNTGIRIIHDPSSHYKHPLLPIVIQIGERMLELTDTIYFDSIISSVFNLKTDHFPETIQLKGPSTYAEKSSKFENYLIEIAEVKKWKRMMEYATGQTYYNSQKAAYKLQEVKEQEHKIVLKPFYAEVMKAGFFPDPQLPHNISQPSYVRGVPVFDNDDLPIIIAINVFVLLVLSMVVAYAAIL